VTLFGLSIATCACAIAYVLARAFATLETNSSFLDHPNRRSLHTVPISRLGGLAILCGLGIVVLVESVFTHLYPDLAGSVIMTEDLRWILGMAMSVGTVSLLEDWRGVPLPLRLTTQSLAAAGVIGFGGVAISVVSVPTVGALALDWFQWPLAFLIIVWMTNLYNFMDGMDGLAGGMAVWGFGCLAYLGWRAGHEPFALLSLVTAGAVGGFLLLNLPPAKIFMGDAGSTTLGFLAASLGLLGVRDGVFDPWVPILIFSVFICDATITLVKRMLQGKKIWMAHREHAYQRLVLAGWGHRKTLGVAHGLMCASVGSAMLYEHLNETFRLALLLGWIVLWMILMGGIARIERRSGITGQPSQGEKFGTSEQGLNSMTRLT